MSKRIHFFSTFFKDAPELRLFCSNGEFCIFQKKLGEQRFL